MRKNRLKVALKTLLAIYWLPALAWADPNLTPGPEIVEVSHGPTIAFTVPPIEHDQPYHPVYLIPSKLSNKFSMAVTMHLWIRQTVIPWKDLGQRDEPRSPLIGIIKNKHLAFIPKNFGNGDKAAIISLVDEEVGSMIPKVKSLNSAIVTELKKHLQNNNIDGAYQTLARHFDDTSAATDSPGLRDTNAFDQGKKVKKQEAIPRKLELWANELGFDKTLFNDRRVRMLIQKKDAAGAVKRLKELASKAMFDKDFLSNEVLARPGHEQELIALIDSL